MAETEIPKSFLSEFANDDSQFENPDGGGADPVTLKTLEESLGWLCTTADKTMKQKGLTGFGEMSADDYAKITALFVRKRFPEALRENSIEFVWALATAGLLGINIMDVLEPKDDTGDDEKTD